MKEFYAESTIVLHLEAVSSVCASMFEAESLCIVEGEV